MYERLKKTFPSLKIFSETTINYPNSYILYVTNDNQIIGIRADEVTKREQDILSTLLTPYELNMPIQSEREQYWLERVMDKENKYHDLPPRFRFVYFTFKRSHIQAEIFKEAIETSFGKTVPILWNNEETGTIIEEIDQQTEDVSVYEQMLQTLIDDLYIDAKLLIGPIHNENTKLYESFHSLKNIGEIAFTYYDKTIISYADARLAYLIHQAEPELREETFNLILNEIKDDKELLHTIKVFFKADLNTTLAAKNLYLHRNSLQYRLDKFIEKTGIDIRKFNNAAIIYLVLLAKPHEEI